MIYTYQNLSKIVFPVYQLPNDNWHVIDGLVYIDTELLDDRNMPASTLGGRRLQSPMGQFFRLRKGVGTIPQMLKFKHFIDSSGKLITYQKTKYHDLRYYKILKVILKDTSSLLWLEGISFPFELPRPPPHGLAYAGVLFLNGNPWLIYDFAHSWSKSTRRMV
jgi:hypothetical protein